MRQALPLTLQLVQGAIGKEFVIKHYRYGRVKTKFPDMSRIVASLQQRKCRNLFRDAVVFAKAVIADKERKESWQKKLRRRNGVYNEAIKYFMLKDKRAKEAAILEANRLLRRAMGYVKPVAIHVPVPVEQKNEVNQLQPLPGHLLHPQPPDLPG